MIYTCWWDGSALSETWTSPSDQHHWDLSRPLQSTMINQRPTALTERCPWYQNKAAWRTANRLHRGRGPVELSDCSFLTVPLFKSYSGTWLRRLPGVSPLITSCTRQYRDNLLSFSTLQLTTLVNAFTLTYNMLSLANSLSLLVVCSDHYVCIRTCDLPTGRSSCTIFYLGLLQILFWQWSAWLWRRGARSRAAPNIFQSHSVQNECVQKQTNCIT